MRAIARFFVERWQISIVAILLVVTLGLNALFTIPKSEDPISKFPVIAVVVILPGTNAEEMERRVAIPLENAMQSLEGVKTVSSTSRSGVVRLTVEFVWGADRERQYDEVVREVNSARPNLPPGIQQIEFIRATTAYANIVQMALVGDGAPMAEMEAQARELSERLRRISGIDTSEIWGTPSPQVRVGLNTAKMVQLGVSPQQIIAAIERSQGLGPMGAVEVGDRVLNLRTAQTYYTSVQQIRDIALRNSGDHILTLADVADVSWTLPEDSYITRYNGKRAIFITARAKLGEDVISMHRRIAEQADAFVQGLPPGIRLETGFDQSANVGNRLNSLGRDFGVALFLVLLTLIPLGLRAGATVAVSIPLSIAIGLVALQFFGQTLNQLSIMGFVIALGLLVDDAIVVTENIVRHVRLGQTPREASMTALSEISVAVIGCTAILMLAFLPLLVLPEGSGEFIRPLPVAILSTVGASLIVAFAIIPFLASRLLPADMAEHRNLALDAVMGLIHRVYRPLLEIALSYPRTTVVAGLAVCLLSIAIVPQLGFTLFPHADTPQFLVQVQLPEGATIAETDKEVRKVEAALAAYPQIVWRMANVGQGNPNVYYNYTQQRVQSNIGDVYASFGTWDPAESPRILEDLRRRFETNAGARIMVRRFENGPPIDTPIAVRVRGRDLRALDELAREVARIVTAVPGTRDVSNSLAERQIDVDLTTDLRSAARLNVLNGAVEISVGAQVAGDRAADFLDSAGDTYPVVVRLPFTGRVTGGVLDNLYVWTDSGSAVPLAALTKPKLASSFAEIDRYKGERTAIISAYTRPGATTSEVTARVAQAIARLQLPPGYAVDFGGEAEAASDSFAGLGAAALIAILGILAVLLLEFGSFGTTAIVALIVPFGFFGGVTALWLAGESLSFIASIGFIALMGIEIKNSILLVDFANQMRRDGMSKHEAIERAGEIRFLPILLTSLTAVASLVPLIIEGSPLLRPLSIVIVGGLVSSTLLARLVTPALYVLLAPAIEMDSPA